MKTIRKANNDVLRIIGNQYYESSLTYCESPYVVKDKDAFYNCLTGEAVVVENLDDDMSLLISKWFYIPSDLDLSSFSHLIRQNRLMATNGPGSRLKNLYVIFTTTACNASCEYCFEKGYDILTMSEETADKVSHYIEVTRNRSKLVTLKWFGGEPLCNTKAIDRICSNLKASGIEFKSDFTSNGALLKNCSDDQLVELWNTKEIQLTFDDIGSEYERIKGLPRGSFDELVKTMERLESLNIHVALRVHFNPDRGKESCIRVIDTLTQFKNVTPYVRMVYDHESIEHYKELLKIQDYLSEKYGNGFRYPSVTGVAHCMANNHRMVGITPNGGLTPCEHYAYGEHIFGNVDSPRVNAKIIENWNKLEKVNKAECKKCPLYPGCTKILNCPAEGDCSKGYRYYRIECIKRALRKERLRG